MSVERHEVVYDGLYELVCRALRDEPDRSSDRLAKVALDAVLKALGDETRHIVQVDEWGWVIQHTLFCRPDLLACPWTRTVSLALSDGSRLWRGRPGLYWSSTEPTSLGVLRLDDEVDLLPPDVNP